MTTVLTKEMLDKAYRAYINAPGSNTEWWLRSAITAILPDIEQAIVSRMTQIETPHGTNRNHT